MFEFFVNSSSILRNSSFREVSGRCPGGAPPPGKRFYCIFSSRNSSFGQGSGRCPGDVREVRRIRTKNSKNSKQTKKCLLKGSQVPAVRKSLASGSTSCGGNSSRRGRWRQSGTNRGADPCLAGFAHMAQHNPPTCPRFYLERAGADEESRPRCNRCWDPLLWYRHITNLVFRAFAVQGRRTWS